MQQLLGSNLQHLLSLGSCDDNIYPDQDNKIVLYKKLIVYYIHNWFYDYVYMYIYITCIIHRYK